jgi:polyisoprenoid-binding protein YceI
MKKLILSLTIAVIGFTAQAQIKKTSTATVTFDATTPKDDWPKATNNAVQCAINTKSGNVEFKMKLDNFTFKDNNAAIKDHWLDPKCMDGKKFPAASFKGKIVDLSKVKFATDGTYEVSVKGKLNIHGKTKEITVPATITVSGGVITTTSSFSITSADFGVSHSAEGAGKVSKTPTISISAELK